jgi:hypothetical protein
MTCQQLLNSIGLVIGMIGILIIFVFGPPQPNLEKGVALGLEDNTILSNGRSVSNCNQEVKDLRKKHTRWSRFGLALIFFGFVFQLGAIFA